MNDHEISKEIYSFFSDRDRREFLFTRDKYVYNLIKSRYDDETEFVYLIRGYDMPTAHEMDRHAAYTGIYSYRTSTLYGCSYDLHFLEPKQESIGDVTSKLVEIMIAEILRRVNGNVKPVACESESSWRNKDYYLMYGLEDEAMKCFYSGKIPNLSPRIDTHNLTISDIIGAINHPQETAERLADDYIIKNEKSISHRLWELSLLPDKIAEIEATSGEHHYRRRIANCIGSEKTVHLDIEKDGASCSCKINTDTLKRTSDSDYSDWNMDAQSRALFYKTYGKGARLFPSDIKKITYGKKTLYEKA